MTLVPGRFTTAAIRIDGGELEVRLSDGGHWQVKAKMVEEDDWRSLCRGHLDGSIFDTAKPDQQAPVRIGPLPGRPRRPPDRGSWPRGAAEGA